MLAQTTQNLATILGFYYYYYYFVISSNCSMIKIHTHTHKKLVPTTVIRNAFRTSTARGVYSFAQRDPAATHTSCILFIPRRTV